jgi:hypothetical protein
VVLKLPSRGGGEREKVRREIAWFRASDEGIRCMWKGKG